MAWTTTPYCQLSDVKLALNTVANNPTVDDQWIQTLIVQAQADMDEYLGFSFQQDGTAIAPASRVYDGQGQAILLIDDCLQVTQVLETTYNVLLGGNGVFVSGTTQTVDITVDCLLQPNNVAPQNLLRRKTFLPFMEGVQNYQVKGVFGQPTLPSGSTVPGDITRACVRLVIHYYKQRDANYSDQVADGQFGKGVKFVPSMPQDVCDILDNHRYRLFLSRPLG